MTREPGQTPPEDGAAPRPSGEGQPYVAPAILWEEEYVALASVSTSCIPGQSPNCT